MRYEKTIPAVFLSRENRFTATADAGGEILRVHVKNTGRCRELLIPGTPVILAAADNPARKTAYDLVAVEKTTARGIVPVNVDSQIANDVAGEWLLSSGFLSPRARILREHTRGDSRFDFYIEDGERKIFLEVKGVTLEEEGRCRFPDAPTERGRKHLRGLIQCRKDGFEAALLFVIQFSGAVCVEANAENDPEFARLLDEAAGAGVQILATDCEVTKDSIRPGRPVPVLLRPVSRAENR